MSVQWVDPLWLAGIPLVLLALWLARRAPGAAITLPRAGMARRGAGTGIRWLARAPDLLRALALVALLLALARPRSVDEVVEEETRGVPIVIALDISSSMLARDFQPRDRLEVAKRTVADFIRARESDPIGLVAFAAEALTLVPITTHEPVLLGALDALRVGLLEDGTSIGDGLITAVNRLRRVDAESRVVILMSDGESNRGQVDPLVAARAAAQVGVRVYTIGVGSEGVAAVPVEREAGRLRYVERPVRIDEPLLREVAEVTGGEYFRATDPEALREVYERIDRLVQSPVQSRRFARYREWYPWLIALAAAALAAEWLLRGSRWGVVP